MRTDPSAKSPEERHLNRRRKLLKRLLATIEELLDEGATYASLSIEQIIQRADISRSSYYRYFADKNDLLLALSESAIGDVSMAMQEVWNLPADTTLEELTDALMHPLTVYRPHANLITAVAGAAAYDAEIGARYRAVMVGIAKAAAAHIKAGQREGFIRPELSATPVAAAIVAMGERTTTQMGPHIGESDARKLTVGFAQIIWYTLYEGHRPADGRRTAGRATGAEKQASGSDGRSGHAT